MLWFWLFAAPALLLGLLSLRGERRRAQFVTAAAALHTDARPKPAATVIVPVKGAEEGLRENLASLAALDYADYELIIVARAVEDIPEGIVPSKARVVVAGEGDPETSEKISNLLAAVQAARACSEIFAFADSDGRVSSGWLRALATPLAEAGVGASTGYRWHLPEPPDFWSLLRSVWNAVIAGGLGPGDNAFAWGGAMAIRRDTFERAGIAEAWKGSVSDDYTLSSAVHSAGLEIAYAPGALVASTDHTTAPEFLGWIRRQMLITRVYRPRLWWTGFLAHVSYCGSMAACLWLIVRGSLLAEYVLMTQLFLGMLKGAQRASLAKIAMPQHGGWFKRYGWVHTWWVPLATWVWLYSFLASVLGDTIRWRGRRYRLRAPGASSFPTSSWKTAITRLFHGDQA